MFYRRARWHSVRHADSPTIVKAHINTKHREQKQTIEWRMATLIGNGVASSDANDTSGANVPLRAYRRHRLVCDVATAMRGNVTYLVTMKHRTPRSAKSISLFQKTARNRNRTQNRMVSTKHGNAWIEAPIRQHRPTRCKRTASSPSSPLQRYIIHNTHLSERHDVTTSLPSNRQRRHKHKQ